MVLVLVFIPYLSQPLLAPVQLPPAYQVQGRVRVYTTQGMALCVPTRYEGDVEVVIVEQREACPP